jgi:ATP-binding cassette, subfamily C, bacterial
MKSGGFCTLAGTISLLPARSACNQFVVSGPPLYVLQVYDRVISSASEVTLVMLTLALLMALLAVAGLDAVRARVLTRASIRLDLLLAGRAAQAA